MVYETCFVGTLSEDAWWWEDVSLDRFTTCPWRPFCLKPMLEKMRRDKPHSMLSRPPTLFEKKVRLGVSALGGQVAGSRAKLLGVKIQGLPAS